MPDRTSKKDVIRLKLATIYVLLLELRRELAEESSKIETGSLGEEQRRYQQESVLFEMLLIDMDSQIIESMMKTMI